MCVCFPLFYQLRPLAARKNTNSRFLRFFVRSVPLFRSLVLTPMLLPSIVHSIAYENWWNYRNVYSLADSRETWNGVYQQLSPLAPCSRCRRHTQRDSNCGCAERRSCAVCRDYFRLREWQRHKRGGSTCAERETRMGDAAPDATIIPRDTVPPERIGSVRVPAKRVPYAGHATHRRNCFRIIFDRSNQLSTGPCHK